MLSITVWVCAAEWYHPQSQAELKAFRQLLCLRKPHLSQRLILQQEDWGSGNKVTFPIQHHSTWLWMQEEPFLTYRIGHRQPNVSWWTCKTRHHSYPLMRKQSQWDISRSVQHCMGMPSLLRQIMLDSAHMSCVLHRPTHAITPFLKKNKEQASCALDIVCSDICVVQENGHSNFPSS